MRYLILLLALLGCDEIEPRIVPPPPLDAQPPQPPPGTAYVENFTIDREAYGKPLSGPRLMIRLGLSLPGNPRALGIETRCDGGGRILVDHGRLQWTDRPPKSVAFFPFERASLPALPVQCAVAIRIEPTPGKGGRPRELSQWCLRTDRIQRGACTLETVKARRLGIVDVQFDQEGSGTMLSFTLDGSPDARTIKAQAQCGKTSIQESVTVEGLPSETSQRVQVYLDAQIKKGCTVRLTSEGITHTLCVERKTRLRECKVLK